MTIHNFNWFLHSILFLHGQKVLNRLALRAQRAALNIADDDDEVAGEEEEGEIAF